MPTSTRKRQRDALSAATSVSPARSALAAHASKTLTLQWPRHDSSSYASDAEAFLFPLGRSITAALPSVAESADAVHAQLRATRMALHAGIDGRCDVLDAFIDSAQISKVASLERELVAVDAALEGFSLRLHCHWQSP